MKDEKGKWRTYSLFWEYRIDNHPYHWTLLDSDREFEGKVIPSLKKIYLDYNHVPGFEYDFAMEVLGSWAHWEKLCVSGVKQHVASWKEELEVKIKANSIKSIIQASIEGEGASKLQAAKYLDGKGYAPTRGRPSKEEKAGRLIQDNAVNNEIADDLERVGLKAIK